MNGFLVTYSGTMDDLPCGLFPTGEAAGYFAFDLMDEVRTAFSSPTNSLFAGPILSRAGKVVRDDVSTFAAISVTEFCDGVPVRHETIFTEDDLPETPDVIPMPANS